jgi:uncharacterized metal-binding protein YceD (DUF177 family)
MTSPLDWTHIASAIGGDGHREERRATVAEREEVARVLDILSCEALAARYEIRPLGEGRFVLSGEIEADVTQACIVTLDPLPARLTDRFTVELRPEEDVSHDDDAGEREIEILTGDDVEPIQDGRIDAGRIMFEHVSAALDPYPRKPDAEFDWRDPKAEAYAKAGGPFAALAKLKQPK